MLYANYIREKMRNLKRSVLPPEYQQVKYIESTGTQYIDTGIVLSTITEVKVITSYSIESRQYIFGTYSRSNYRLCSIGNNIGWCGSIEGSYLFTYPTLNVNQKYIQLLHYENNNCYYKEDDIVKWSKNDEAYYSNKGNSIYLFANNSYGSATDYANAKLYEAQISQNGYVVQKLIPCYRKSDNVIGMYDLVNNKFYTNARTGEFIKGGNV